MACQARIAITVVYSIDSAAAKHLHVTIASVWSASSCQVYSCVIVLRMLDSVKFIS